MRYLQVQSRSKENTMLNNTKKTVLILALTFAPLSAFAQTTDTTATPSTTDTTTTGTTTNATNDNRNDSGNWGWLGLLGLLGLAGLRRQPVTVVPERTMTGNANNRS